MKNNDGGTFPGDTGAQRKLKLLNEVLPFMRLYGSEAPLLSKAGRDTERTWADGRAIFMYRRARETARLQISRSVSSKADSEG